MRARVCKAPPEHLIDHITQRQRGGSVMQQLTGGKEATSVQHLNTHKPAASSTRIHIPGPRWAFMHTMNANSAQFCKHTKRCCPSLQSGLYVTSERSPPVCNSCSLQLILRFFHHFCSLTDFFEQKPLKRLIPNY